MYMLTAYGALRHTQCEGNRAVVVYGFLGNNSSFAYHISYNLLFLESGRVITAITKTHKNGRLRVFTLSQ